MTRLVSLLFILGMIVQIIRPLGYPGLRKRGDAWKLAAAAFGVIMLTVLIRPH